MQDKMYVLIDGKIIRDVPAAAYHHIMMLRERLTQTQRELDKAKSDLFQEQINWGSNEARTTEAMQQADALQLELKRAKLHISALEGDLNSYQLVAKKQTETIAKLNKRNEDIRSELAELKTKFAGFNPYAIYPASSVTIQELHALRAEVIPLRRRSAEQQEEIKILRKALDKIHEMFSVAKQLHTDITKSLGGKDGSSRTKKWW